MTGGHAGRNARWLLTFHPQSGSREQTGSGTDWKTHSDLLPPCRSILLKVSQSSETAPPIRDPVFKCMNMVDILHSNHNILEDFK